MVFVEAVIRPGYKPVHIVRKPSDLIVELKFANMYILCVRFTNRDHIEEVAENKATYDVVFKGIEAKYIGGEQRVRTCGMHSIYDYYNEIEDDCSTVDIDLYDEDHKYSKDEDLY